MIRTLGLIFAMAWCGIALAQDAPKPPAPTPPTPPSSSPAPPKAEPKAEEKKPETPAPPPAPSGPQTYIIDGKKSALVLQLFKDGAAAAFAHDHTVHATEIAGEIVADPAAPETAKVSVTVQTKSLVNDDAQVRRTFGLDPTVPEKDKKEVDKSMKGADQLDVARFPTITFKSTAVEKHGDKYTLVGDFTLHGVTKQIKMPINVQMKDGNIVGDGKVRFKQSDYGITPYSAFLGAVKNKDEVVLNVHLVATPK